MEDFNFLIEDNTIDLSGILYYNEIHKNDNKIIFPSGEELKFIADLLGVKEYD